MRRRHFMALLGGALAAPALTRDARAQQPPVVGYLGAESPERFASRLHSSRAGLAKAGFEEGRNVTIEYRWAEGHNDRLPALANELVQRGVSVIAAPGSAAAALAAKGATARIPIVFETGADPIAVGLVGSLNQPSGNITGVTSLNLEVNPKRLELLHDVVPTARSFALLVNPTNPRSAQFTAADIQKAARTLGVELNMLQASTEEQLGNAFAAMTALHASSLVIESDPFFATRSAQIAKLAVEHALPAVHQSREFAAAGGLMSYGGSTTESHTQAGLYVGRILKGEKPGELPVQRVTKVVFVVNLKAAHALKIEVPPTLLALADEVIE